LSNVQDTSFELLVGANLVSGCPLTVYSDPSTSAYWLTGGFSLHTPGCNACKHSDNQSSLSQHYKILPYIKQFPDFRYGWKDIKLCSTQTAMNFEDTLVKSNHTCVESWYFWLGIIIYITW